MDNDSGFFVALMLASLFYIFGPTFREVDAEMWAKAEVACAPVGGVAAVELSTFYSRFEVTCNNGMSIQLSTYK